MKTVNLEEILFKDSGMEKFKKDFPKTYQTILKKMREACKQVLELAAENVLLNINGITEKSNGQTYYVEEGNHYSETEVTVDKESILDTLNQVE